MIFPLFDGSDAPEAGNASGERPWQQVQNRRRNSRWMAQSRARAWNSNSAAGLTGAARTKYSAFHLGGISLLSQADDILRYCQDRKVLVTGVYWLRTRVWGTQSAKLYLSVDAAERVLSEHFWPQKIRCRAWRSSPPESQFGGNADCS